MVKRTDIDSKAGVPASAEPQVTAVAAPLPVDEFHGVGGSYVIEHGVRRRVEGPPLDGQATEPTL